MQRSFSFSYESEPTASVLASALKQAQTAVLECSHVTGDSCPACAGGRGPTLTTPHPSPAPPVLNTTQDSLARVAHVALETQTPREAPSSLAVEPPVSAATRSEAVVKQESGPQEIFPTLSAGAPTSSALLPAPPEVSPASKAAKMSFVTITAPASDPLDAVPLTCLDTPTECIGYATSSGPVHAVAARAVPKFFNTKATEVALKFENLDLDRTVILTSSKGRFKLVPLSRAAGTKMILAERRFDSDSGMNQAMSYAVVANLQLPMDSSHPLAGLLAQYGLNLVLSQQAMAGLKRIRREFNRIMVPFKFHVPVQFKDLQGKDDDYVTGPFIPDVYGAEVNGYMKRMERLGLIDPAAEFHLYGYQAEDVAQLACKHYGFINHDMGLGKTLIAAALIQMHGYERVLVIAPGAAIGSFQSGWRHELKRMGIPEDHIHVVEGPEDLPADKLQAARTKSFVPFSDKPHVYLVDYTTLAKEKWEHSAYQCDCGYSVSAKDKGKCPSCKKHAKWCSQCFNAAFSAGTIDEEELEAAWTGRFCKTCGWTSKKRVPTEGRLARAEMLMGHAIKRLKYRKTKNLTPDQHKAVDDLMLHEKIEQSRSLLTASQANEISGLLSEKPLWKHIHNGMFKFLLMDESHMVKDNSTRRGNAIQMLKGLQRVYVMTGTMLTNYVSDSFWQLQRLFPGGLFPVNRQLQDFSAHKGMKKGEELFLNKFEGRTRRTSGRRVSNIHEPEKFWGLMARVQLRRHDDDADVQTQVILPDPQFHTEYIEMDPFHRDLYRMKTGEFQADIRRKIASARGQEYANKIDVSDLAPINPADLRTKLQDLRQIAACPDQTGIYNNKNGSIRMTTKDARILELVTDAVARNEKTVVFCSWISQILRLQMFLKEKGISVMTMDGRTSKHTKWANIDEWRSDTSAMVMLASIDSMGQAVNLTSLVPEEFKCAQVLFGSPEWAPNKMEQAWCRVHRIGQTEQTQVYFLYHKDTIEEDMDELLYQKRITIAKAQDRVEISREDTQTVLTYAEIAARILNKGFQEATQ